MTKCGEMFKMLFKNMKNLQFGIYVIIIDEKNPLASNYLHIYEIRIKSLAFHGT